MSAQNRRRPDKARRREDVAQAHLASLVLAAPDAITGETLDGRISTWNRGAERIYGYSAGEIIGQPASVLVPPERYEEDRRIVDSVKQGQSISRLETVRRRKDGTPVEVLIDLAPVFHPGGGIASICRITHPGAGAARADETLRDAGQWLRDKDQKLFLALAASGAGVFRFNMTTNECEYDEAFARLWGVPLGDQFRNAASVLERVHPDERSKFLSTLEHCTREGAEFELEHRVVPSAGRTRWLFTRGKTFADDAGHPSCMTGVSVDVTHRRRAEDALRQSEERFRSLAEAIPSIVWECDPQGRALYKNRVWFDYTGQRADDATAEDWPRFYHLDDRERLLREWEESRAQGTVPYDTEARIRRRDGVYRWFRIRAAPIRDRRDAIVRWAGTCTDVDDQKRAGQALEEADRHKNQFLAMLAHELRSPLASIRNAADIVKMSAEGNAGLRHTAGVIARQADQLGRLVADLLDLSNVSRGKLALRRQQCDLLAVISHALEMNRSAVERKRHRLDLALPDAPLVMLGDAGRLVQLVSNLVGNAVRYTPDEGTIQIALYRKGAHAVLHVRDTGIGIEPALLPRVFDLFVQGERPQAGAENGLGIGLALVKEIAAMHGGNVKAYSRGRGQGAEFTVFLPLRPGKSDKAKTSPGPAEEPEARRILIVDDNRDYADSLAMLLQQAGHQTLTAYDSPSAVARAIEFAPDVTLLDIDLPGIDGYELCRRLRREPALRHTLHIAVSGYGQDADRTKSREAGFAYHLTKPVRLPELTRIISSGGGARPGSGTAKKRTAPGDPDPHG